MYGQPFTPVRCSHHFIAFSLNFLDFVVALLLLVGPVIDMLTSINTAPKRSVPVSACGIALGVLLLTLAGCGSGEQGDPTITTTATSTGVMASLRWDPVQPQTGEPAILGYYIHYGKGSPGQAGSCSYDDVKFVTTPSGTVTGLDPGSRYYFAVSAYNGVEGNCSNEVSTDT